MKDENGNGLTVEEMNELTLRCAKYENKISQNGNGGITYFHEWSYSRDDGRPATLDEQKQTIEAWFTIDKPQGIHLRVREATITHIESITLKEYYQWLCDGSTDEELEEDLPVQCEDCAAIDGGEIEGCDKCNITLMYKRRFYTETPPSKRGDSQ